MSDDDESRILSGLLWLATMPATPGQLTRFQQAEAMCKGVGSMRRAGVPEALIADAYRPDLQGTDALEAARRWAEWKRPRDAWESEDVETSSPRMHGLLILRGTVGTGKSAAMAWLLARLIDAGRWHARWIDCRALVSSGWDEVNALANLAHVPILLLDDLSAAVANRDAALAAFVSLLGRRHELGLLTVVTSNLPLDALEIAADVAVWDRLGQDGETVACEGTSLRKSVDRSELAAAIRGAERLVHLVRRLAQGTRVTVGPGVVGPEVTRLPEVEAVQQLGRLLGATLGQARRAARLADEHDARQAEAHLQAMAVLAGGIKRPPGHVDVDHDELEAARRRRRREAEAEIEALLERDRLEAEAANQRPKGKR
jgi:hypothetical protein